MVLSKAFQPNPEDVLLCFYAAMCAVAVLLLCSCVLLCCYVCCCSGMYAVVCVIALKSNTLPLQFPGHTTTMYLYYELFRFYHRIIATRWSTKQKRN